MHFIVFLFAILILLLIVAIIGLHILANNFDMSKHYKQMLGKLVNKPELNRYENKTYEFGIELIDRETYEEFLTGLQLDDEIIGKHLFKLNDTFVIYDYRRDKIIYIYR